MVTEQRLLRLHSLSCCVWCGPAAPSAPLRPLHQELPGQEVRGPGSPGSGVRGRLQSRSGPPVSRETRPALVQRACDCCCLVVTLPVAAGVLQQLRWDVVPEGNHTVLTVMDGLHSPTPPITARPALRTRTSAACSELDAAAFLTFTRAARRSSACGRN